MPTSARLSWRNAHAQVGVVARAEAPEGAREARAQGREGRAHTGVPRVRREREHRVEVRARHRAQRRGGHRLVLERHQLDVEHARHAVLAQQQERARAQLLQHGLQRPAVAEHVVGGWACVPGVCCVGAQRKERVREGGVRERAQHPAQALGRDVGRVALVAQPLHDVHHLARQGHPHRRAPQVRHPSQLSFSFFPIQIKKKEREKRKGEKREKKEAKK